MAFTILELNEQRIPQYGAVRRHGETPSGVVGVHTAENDIDLQGVDLGAENVASYILTRTDYGSYHDLVDADSILHLAPYIAETWGAPAINPHGYHVSAAVRAAQWHRIPEKRRKSIIRNMAIAAADFAEWLEEYYGIIVPARRLTKAEAEAKKPGFVAHGDLDPGRRSDPGEDFDWDLFLEYFAELRGLKVGTDVKQPTKPSKPKTPPAAAQPPKGGSGGGSTAPKSYLPLRVDGDFGAATITELQRAIKAAGFYDGGYVDGQTGHYTWAGYQKFLDSTGAYRGVIDGNFGGYSVEAEQIFLKAVGHYDGPIDRDRGSNTIKALQKALNAGHVRKGIVKVDVEVGTNATFVNPAVGRITGTYGYRIHPVTGQRGNLHKGLDIANSRGTPIYAAYGGTVRAVRKNSYRGDKRGNSVTGTWNTGNFVLIDGPGGGSEWYGHLHKIYVKPGQKVNAGDVIGTMGDTGNVTGVHLHFETWSGRTTHTHHNPMIDFNKFGITPGKSKPSKVGDGKVSFKVLSSNVKSSGTSSSKKTSSSGKSQRVAGTDRYITVDGEFGYYTKLALQQILHNRGYKGHAIDGDFGALSTKSFQRWLRDSGQRGHSIDGHWGSATTTSLQKHLRALGYKGHAIDGKLGPATITSLQQALVDGKVK